MNNVTLNFSLDEINVLLSIIGDLPNKTNTYALLAKIKSDAEAELKKNVSESD